MQSRRSFIKNFNITAAVGLTNIYWPNLFGAFEEQSLRDAAAGAGLRYGSHSDVDLAGSPAEYQQLFLRHVGLYAPNWVWERNCPTPDAKELIWEDPNISYALQHKIPLTGGHLLWHHRTPDWFISVHDPEAVILNYIKTINHYYGKSTYSWNVVNEAINAYGGRNDYLDNNQFMKRMGTSYFKVAFDAAKSVAPQIIRVYNDFGFEMDDDYCAKRRKTLLTLLDKFKKDGTPVDAIGLQSHLTIDNKQRFNEKIYRNFLNDISLRGYDILITEFDVLDRKTQRRDIEGRDREVADMYSRFLPVALDEPAVKALITWDISDRYTWLTAKAGPEYSRPDRQPTRPHPFDKNFRPKPAYYSLLNALKHAPKREWV